MIGRGQERVLAFLAGSERHGGVAVATEETHISVVVLAGGTAYKLKRECRLPYLDFSTPEKRLAACERECRLNRRTAPGLYRGVRRITEEADGTLAFDGRGALVDAVVEMARFDAAARLDRVADRGGLSPPMLTALARSIAQFHAEEPGVADWNGAARVGAVLRIGEEAFRRTSLFGREAVERFNGMFRRALDRHAPLLDARAAAGSIRHCHGDLHLANICLVDGVPIPYDCLEFNDELATIDVLYDLAFLLMDLWARGRTDEANLVLNRYLDARDETDGLPLVGFFMALRAAVRAHVVATRSEASGETDGRSAREAAGYFALAERLLEPVPPRLVAVGGLSGSGKSTVAAALAGGLGPPPGARVVASDRVRKRLFGAAPEARLAEEAYAPGASRRVYAEVGRQAARVLALGHAALADAVFGQAEERARIAAVARAAGVPFDGLWLEAPLDVLLARVAARQGDPSDATAEVVRRQAACDPGTVDWKRVAAGGERGDAARHARAALSDACAPPPPAAASARTGAPARSSDAIAPAPTGR